MHVPQRFRDEIKRIDPDLDIIWDQRINRYVVQDKVGQYNEWEPVMVVEEPREDPNVVGAFRPLDRRTIDIMRKRAYMLDKFRGDYIAMIEAQEDGAAKLKNDAFKREIEAMAADAASHAAFWGYS